MLLGTLALAAGAATLATVAFVGPGIDAPPRSNEGYVAQRTGGKEAPTAVAMALRAEQPWRP